MMFLFMACTQTKYSATWIDQTYQGRPEKVLVINAFQDPATRRLFEDELVKALKDRRIDAVMSYTVMTDPVVSDKAAIEAHAKEIGVDTVLINKPLGTRTEESSPFYDVYQDVFISTQTEVFDMKSNGLVLTVSAETWIREGIPNRDLIHSYVKDLIKKLSRMGLF